MKKVKTLEDKGGKPAEKIANAKHGSKDGLVRPRKSESPAAYTKGGKKPQAEVAHPHETQPRSANKDASKAKQAPKSASEESYPEDFNRFGQRMVTEAHVKPGFSH